MVLLLLFAARLSMFVVYDLRLSLFVMRLARDSRPSDRPVEMVPRQRPLEFSKKNRLLDVGMISRGRGVDFCCLFEIIKGLFLTISSKVSQALPPSPNTDFFKN